MSPRRERVRAQARKLNALSQGIRGLQAKMQILREESNRAIEGAADSGDVGSLLLAQYESIGDDLRQLTHTWESGKTALALSLERHEDRLSQPDSRISRLDQRLSSRSSGGLRSPVSSLSGATAVEDGSPSAALRALNGGSQAGSSRSSRSNSATDEEVFEAISLPKQRQPMTREQRLHKLDEDRVRHALMRERLDANSSMMKELHAVINLRPQRSNRITSI